MQSNLREFRLRVTGTVVMTLIPMGLITSQSMPLSLGRHPGEVSLSPNVDFERPTTEDAVRPLLRAMLRIQ